MVSLIDLRFFVVAHRERSRYHMRMLRRKGYDWFRFVSQAGWNHIRDLGRMSHMLQLFMIWMRLSPQVKERIIAYLPDANGDLRLALYHYNLESYIASVKARNSSRAILVDHGLGIVEMI